MDNARIAAISKRLNATLSPEAWVVAISRNGSTVAGTDRPESDVDFTVIVRQKKDRARARRLLVRKFGYPFLGLEHGVPTFRDRRKIGVVILDRPTLEGWLLRLYRTPEEFLELQGVVQHKLVEAVPVHDPQRLLKSYQRAVKAYPQRIRKVVFSRALRSLEAAEANWGSRNEFHYAFELPSLLENISLALYARNRRLFMVPFKRLPTDLPDLHPNIEAEMFRLVRSGRSSTSRNEARNALRSVIRKLRAAG